MLFGFLVFGVGISLVSGLHVVHAQTDQVVDASTLQNNANTVALALILNAITYILNLVVAALGKLTLLMIQILIIPILNYNSFSTSPIIGLGWSLVRDVMNMFVIVALIFIAIFTIVGNHRAHWEQQLPQLFIAVVFMNFSRTICGILIDISQVIMFTFVNALLDIAAGNFAQLFQLPDFGKYNLAAVESALKNGTSVAEPFKQFMEAFLQVPLYMSIFAILFLLAIAFLYRIVVLWVLVILSPLAFFLGGIKGIFQHADAGKWWKQFTGALLMGPILAFFLWLALAAASSGSIAESEAFPLPQDADTYFSIQALDSSHLTSLLLALILLMVGMQVAGEQSSNLGGLASQVINEGMGRRVVGGSLTLPFRAGRSAAGAAVRTADVYGARALGMNETLREGFGKGTIQAGKYVAERGGIVGATLGQGLMAGGANIELQGEHLRAERRKASKDRISSMSDAQKVASLQLAKSGKPSGLMTAEDVLELNAQYATDKRFRKESEHFATEKQRETMLGDAMNTSFAEKDKLDDAAKTKLFATMSENLHLIKGKNGKSDEDAIREFVRSDDFVPSKMGNTAVNNDKVQRVLGDEKDRNAKDENLTYLDRVKDGKYTARLNAGSKDILKTAATEKAFNELRSSGDVGAIKKAFEDKKIGLGDVKVEDVQGTGGKALVQAIATSDLNINALGSGETDPARKTQITQEFVNNVVAQQDAGTIASAFQGAKISPNDLKAEMFDNAPSPAQRVELVRGVIGAKANVNMMSTDAQNAFAKSVQDLRTTGNLTTKESAQAHGMLLGAGKTIQEVLPTVNLDPQNITMSSGDRAQLAQILKDNIANTRHFAPAVSTATAPNEVTKIIVENTKTSKVDGKYASPDVDQLAGLIENAKGQVKTQLRESLDSLAKAVSLEQSATPWPKNHTPTAQELDKRQRIEDLHDQIQTTMRTLP